MNTGRRGMLNGDITVLGHNYTSESMQIELPYHIIIIIISRISLCHYMSINELTL
jgi:hypothetical protein